MGENSKNPLKKPFIGIFLSTRTSGKKLDKLKTFSFFTFQQLTLKNYVEIVENTADLSTVPRPFHRSVPLLNKRQNISWFLRF